MTFRPFGEDTSGFRATSGRLCEMRRGSGTGGVGSRAIPNPTGESIPIRFGDVRDAQRLSRRRRP
jgi:hypothetical protein